MFDEQSVLGKERGGGLRYYGVTKGGNSPDEIEEEIDGMVSIANCEQNIPDQDLLREL